MPPVLNDLMASKKFLFVFVISALVLIAAKFGVLTKPETLGLLGVLWPVYLGAQGFSDVGQKIADAHVFVQTERQALISQDKVALHGMITTMMPEVLKVMQQSMPAARSPIPGFSFEPAAAILRKNQRVVWIPLGPDEIGVILEDQKLGTMTVQAMFKGDPEGGKVYDRADLIPVTDDYIGPTATAAARAAKTADKPASAGAS
jgi:hypothetical protein